TAPFYVEVDTFMEGEMLALPIVLGDMGVPLEDLYGLAFSIVYDSTIIEVSSVGVGFEDSWLGDIDDNMIAMQRDFYSPGKVNVAMTRIDGMPMAGFGEIARIYLTIQDDILLLGADTRSPIEGTAVEFEIADVLLINHLGEMISVDPMATTSLLTDLETSLDPEILDNSVRVYPNPAQEVIYIQSENIKLEKVSFFNLLGQKIKSLTIHSEQSIELMTDELVEGTYLLEIQTEGGRLTKRIVLSQ
ncbi:MAG: T9SS type A sorting domain-containing protein, partial [Bacteroidota bacterium]